MKDDTQSKYSFIDKAYDYHNRRIKYDPVYAQFKNLGYIPYIPRDRKGRPEAIPPRVDDRGMDLNTGEVDPHHKLAIANPTLDPKDYARAIKSI